MPSHPKMLLLELLKTDGDQVFISVQYDGPTPPEEEGTVVIILPDHRTSGLVKVFLRDDQAFIESVTEQQPDFFTLAPIIGLHENKKMVSMKLFLDNLILARNDGETAFEPLDKYSIDKLFNL